jgi:hypothetical protein
VHALILVVGTNASTLRFLDLDEETHPSARERAYRAPSGPSRLSIDRKKLIASMPSKDRSRRRGAASTRSSVSGERVAS